MAATVQGVSIVICCYNSASRLPATLRYLKNQRVSSELSWEVIVVDNSSTDDTRNVAYREWVKSLRPTLRVVTEPQLGLSHARNRGFLEAKYEVVSFVDDDNWVCPDWVELVSEIMSQFPDVGACGGISEAVCEINPPPWFERYKKGYAVGLQGDEPGDVSRTRGYLWGAGLSVRKSAWQDLLKDGFRPLLIDRRGTTNSSGGDAELSFALRLRGWRLWYDPRLQLRHFLQERRFDWSYLRGLFRGFGAASVWLDLYRYALKDDPTSFIEQFKQSRQFKTLSAFAKLFWYGAKAPLSLYYPSEGNRDALEAEFQIGRLSELGQFQKPYKLSLERNRC